LKNQKNTNGELSIDKATNVLNLKVKLSYRYARCKFHVGHDVPFTSYLLYHQVLPCEKREERTLESQGWYLDDFMVFH